jgi:hypothetical protein
MIIDEVAMSRWVGGWVEGVKPDIRRPHSPIALSPPYYNAWYKAPTVTKRDALGLTPAQRASVPSFEDEYRAEIQAFFNQMRANWDAWDALPDDAMVLCELCGESHSVRMYR